VALAALRQKQAYEGELNRIAGTRLTLEAQVNAIETANLNAETMIAMKKGADALKGIHGNLWAYYSCPLFWSTWWLMLNPWPYVHFSNINKVDATMESIREQMDLSNEISDAISNPVNMGIEVDDVSWSFTLLSLLSIVEVIYHLRLIVVMPNRTNWRTSLKSSSRNSWTSD
jgi:charged multivesicular body protein 4